MARSMVANAWSSSTVAAKLDVRNHARLAGGNLAMSSNLAVDFQSNREQSQAFLWLLGYNGGFGNATAFFIEVNYLIHRST